MKHLTVTVSALAIVSSIVLLVAGRAANAQNPALEKVQRLAQVLNLTPEQKSQLVPILEAEGPKIQSIVHDPNLSPKDKDKQLQAVYDQTDPLVKAILTETQYKMWKQIRKDELEKLKQGGGL
jgi:hypothetical protein